MARVFRVARCLRHLTLNPTPVMSPTALHSYSESSPLHVASPVLTKGTALAIGSLSTAQDGRYQSLITHLEENRQVERQMLDRLVDGGEQTHRVQDRID